MSDIVLVERDEQVLACFPALHVLRPHLDESEFLARVRRQQGAGYRLVAIADGPRVVAVAGFRLLEFLAWGSVLYIDDLVTLPEARGQGHGGRLLDWLADHARAHGCAAVHLDTGYQRHDAHRLYLRKGFVLAAHHCALALRP